MSKKVSNISEEIIEKKLKDFKEFYRDRKVVIEEFSARELAKKIDHTILKPEATPDEIKKLCEEANEYEFASVCVNSSYVPLCNELLKGTEVKVCTVVGFPLGAMTTAAKRFEAEEAITNGASEVDMVINVGQLKSKNYEYVFNDIQQVVEAAKRNNALTKVILEAVLLTDEEKTAACLICKEAGADFVKTSTGFNKGGATINDVALMKFVIGPEMKVKASGGIRTKEDVLIMIANGADRIGASAGVKIVTGES